MRYTISDSFFPYFMDIKIEGSIDPNEIDRILQEVLSDSRWQTGTGLIFDYSKVNIYCFPVSSIDNLTKVAHKNREKLKDSRCAIIVNPLTDLTVINIFETLADRKSNHRIRIFINFDDASSWLKSQGS